MVKRILLAFGVLGLALASAASGYKLVLKQPSIVKGKELTAGEYRVQVQGSTVTIVSGKTSVEIPATVESAGQEYKYTSIRYTAEGGKRNIAEICLGGTSTRLVFQP
jgi:hypothetical protein